MGPENTEAAAISNSEQHAAQHGPSYLWRNAFFFSLILVYFTSLYLYFQHDEYTLRIFNKSVAWVSVLLIGLSLGMSSLCYFFDFLDKKIIYRKQFGVWGFVYALIHGVISVYLVSTKFNVLDFFLGESNRAAFFSAVISLVILTFLTGISNNSAIKIFGGQRWRHLMRLGYIAFLFGVIHFFLKRYEDIFEWIESGVIFPPIAGSIFILSLLVFVGRIFMIIHSYVARKKSTTSAHPQETSQV